MTSLITMQSDDILTINTRDNTSLAELLLNMIESKDHNRAFAIIQTEGGQFAQVLWGMDYVGVSFEDASYLNTFNNIDSLVDLLDTLNDFKGGHTVFMSYDPSNGNDRQFIAGGKGAEIENSNAFATYGYVRQGGDELMWVE